MIPKVIHQTAPGDKSSLIPAFINNIDSLMAVNPSWQHRFWSDDDIVKFLKRSYPTSVLARYESINPAYGAARADYFRYLMMYQFGGLYLDIKSTATKPLDDVILPNDTYILSQWGEEYPRWGKHEAVSEEYQQWFIVCEPRHPFLKAVIDLVEKNIDHYTPGSHGVGRTGVLHTTGPIAYTLALEKVIDSMPFRLVTNEEMGFRYSIFPGNGHREKFPGHYTERTDPVILPNTKDVPKKLAKLGQKICLNMIVKNEAHVIKRCLDSLKHIIDHWVIVDTGSTDGTQDLIKQLLADVPGELHERPWVDFGHNRTEAIQLARQHGDYLLFIDADEQFKVPPKFEWPRLAADGYNLVVEYGTTEYPRLALVSTKIEWRSVGVVHEYLESATPAKTEDLHSLRIFVLHDGARARDPETYVKDAAVLLKAIDNDPLNTRYVFYLAQSYFDCGNHQQASRWYRKRISMQGYDEERFYSSYRLARMFKAAGQDSDFINEVLYAFQRWPHRLEPVFVLCEYWRGRNEHHLCALFADAAKKAKIPASGLFLEPGVYEWKVKDEVSISLYWIGRFQEALDLAREALAKAPEDQKKRIDVNAKFSETAIKSGRKM